MIYLNENDPINNNSDSSKDKEKQRRTKTHKKAPTTVILGDSILKHVYGNVISKATKFKKHVLVKHFSGAKVGDMKHYVKPTQEKSPAQIVSKRPCCQKRLQWNSKRNCSTFQIY